jgi:C-terminal processing protease CtpA/Prc
VASLGLLGDHLALVKIAPDGAADLAGLHVGDVVESVDGKRVRSAAEREAVLVNEP